jgi:hypothetical protein
MATTRRRFFSTIWNLLLSAALFAGCGGAGATIALPAETAPRINPPDRLPAALGDWPALGERNPGVPGDYDLVGESGTLRLYLKRATSALIVEDKRNGRLWRNSPADLKDNSKISAVWRRRIESPILVNYSGPDRGQAKVTNPQTMQMDYAPVEGGARATYRFPAEGFELGVVYAVRDDCLQVTLPADEIVESKAGNGLASVAVLSFFGATHDGEEGYIFFPDGSGALVRYTTSHPAAVQEISTVIYGADEISTSSDSHFQQPAVLPVFGQVSGDAAFVGMITQGDFDASIAMARSGQGLDYNHTWANFIFRRKGLFSLTGAQPTRLFEPDRIGGDRQVRYCFLAGERANYVGMATRYREFLIRERGARRMAAQPPLMHLAFFMGIERKTWFLRDLIAMTTFAEAQTILAQLAAAGVARVDVTLVNWNQGGVGGRYPQRLPVEPRLGGEGGLRALAADIRQRRQRLFLQDNYLNLRPEAQGVVPYLDAIRGVDGLPVSAGAQAYFLNAQVALRQFAAHDMPAMTGLGAGGLWLDDFAGLAVPDTNDRYPLSRENFAASWMQISDLAREEFGAAAMTGGNGYAIPHADALIAVPMDSTHYDLSDETVPFYQIVAHGLLSYTGEPYNLHNDGRRTFLHQVEYGAVPLFVLTEANSALLYRTEANGLWSTQYSFWRDELIRQYRQMEPLAPLTDQFIAGHARLAEDVYQTTYEDGTRVVVNYSTQPYAAGPLAVPAEDFVVIPGEE